MMLVKHDEHLSVPLTTPPFLSPTTLFLYILCSSVIPPSCSVIFAHHSIYTYPDIHLPERLNPLGRGKEPLMCEGS